MPEFLTRAVAQGGAPNPVDVLSRLMVALILGGVVAAIYALTRRRHEVSGSFLVTLVLLSILIAMVTQVIGDNVARAFSLVGALSIVRFRTVVRDTQDTAYVIFAVVVGMAVGAQDLWVGAIGIGVVGLAAFVLMWRPSFLVPAQPMCILTIRVGLGMDLTQVLEPALRRHLSDFQTMSIGTARQGAALEIIYEGRLGPSTTPGETVKALNRIEGVQSVEVRRRGYTED